MEVGDAQGIELVTRGAGRQSQRKMAKDQLVEGSMVRPEEGANQPMLIVQALGFADLVAKLISSPIELAMLAVVQEGVATLGSPSQKVYHPGAATGRAKKAGYEGF